MPSGHHVHRVYAVLTARARAILAAGDRAVLSAGFCAILAAGLCAILFSACTGARCTYCVDALRDTLRATWNVETQTGTVHPCTQEVVTSISTPIEPVMLVRAGGIRYLKVYVPCTDGELKTVEIQQPGIARITSTSDPLVPPRPVNPDDACINCTRVRDGLLGFDKVELRAMGGYRGPQTAVFYPSAAGGVLYEPDVFGFDRGGTNVTVGAEAAFLWDVARLSRSATLHLGVLAGVWPADGSTFIPLSLHPRVTWNNRPDPYGCNCDAWYVFGDAGLATLGPGGAPYEPIFDKRFFYGAGLGYEWALGRDVDLALDVYYRRQHHPLPAIDCCPEIPAALRHSVRLLHVFGLRLGVTF